MKDQLTARFEPFGQQAVLRFWDTLDEAAQRQLGAQLEDIDPAQIAQLYASRAGTCDYGAIAAKASSPPAVRLDGSGLPISRDDATAAGRDALARGKVGVILVAGGQGSRLGFDHPKGMYPIGPVTERTLYQIHAEKVLALSRQYGKPVPLYVMTSPATDAETRQFFDEHDRFDIPEQDFQIFCQGTMPSVEEATGQLLLAEKDSLALSPDGHGGTLAALHRSGALADIERREIETLFYFQVDNPMIDVASATFLGFHILAGSEMTSQVVAKTDPMEKVGNVVDVAGQVQVIEYIDLPDEAACRTNADGSLAIWAGSIAVHAFDVAFLKRLAGTTGSLPFHIARKKVTHLDEKGNRITPSESNAIKFEQFIFDLMPSASCSIVVEIEESDGFSPLKNASGAVKDTPEAVRADLSAKYRGWLKAAGGELPDDVLIEISPLDANDAEQLTERIASDATFVETKVLTK